MTDVIDITPPQAGTNDFHAQIKSFADEAIELQKKELTVDMENKLFLDKFMGFLKQNGLPEKFTLPELVLLAANKSR